MSDRGSSYMGRGRSSSRWRGSRARGSSRGRSSVRGRGYIKRGRYSSRGRISRGYRAGKFRGDTTKTKQIRSTIPCQFGDQCSHYKTGTCEFLHIQQTQKTTQKQIRSTIPCQFGDKCTHYKSGNCEFLHNKPPKTKPIRSTTPCQYGANCKHYKKGNCAFFHESAKYKADPKIWLKTQFVYSFNKKFTHHFNKSSSINISKIEFANNSIGYVNEGAVARRIVMDHSVMKGQSIHLTWHTGRSTGHGKALFEGDGSALLAVERLKNVTFGGQKLVISDPEKAENENDGVYKLKLSNIPLHFDDEMLTKSLIKLNLDNLIAARIFFDTTGYEHNALVAVQLKSLLTPYNLKDIKTYPARKGVCTANAILNSMADCLNIIREKNNKPIDFGVSGGKLKIKLDVRVVIELEAKIYDILRPEIQKTWNIIKWSPAQFYGVKVFLIPKHKTSSNKPRIVIIGSESKAINLAKKFYDRITQPLSFKFDHKSKCRLIYKYLKTKQFSNFKCCAVQILIHANIIKIYGTKEVKDIFQNAIQEFDKNIVCHNITNVSPLLIRKCLRQKKEMQRITEFGQFGVYVHIDVIRKLVQIIYCTKLPLKIENEMKNNDIDDNDCTDQQFIASVEKGEKCIEYIEQLLKENKQIKKEGKSNDGSAICGVCFMEIEANEGSYKLNECGHLFHSDCIEMQLNCASEANGTRPIQCASCNDNISLVDIKSILNDDNKYHQLLIYAINDYVKMNPNKYRYCPTPECKQIYPVIKDDDEKKKENINDNDNIFNCTECLRQYCVTCGVSYHFGMSCKEYFVSANSDESLKVFLDSYESDKSTQKCPNCNISADKLPHTCNHATCVYCNAHFCWKCTWMDPNNNKDGGLVYRHMRSIHNGYYG